MKSRAERLDEILYRFHRSKIDNTSATQDTVFRIVSLFKECVPEEKSVKQCNCITWENCGCVVDDFNKCRTETLKNIEELR